MLIQGLIIAISDNAAIDKVHQMLHGAFISSSSCLWLLELRALESQYVNLYGSMSLNFKLKPPRVPLVEKADRYINSTDHEI